MKTNVLFDLQEIHNRIKSKSLYEAVTAEYDGDYSCEYRVSQDAAQLVELLPGLLAVANAARAMSYSRIRMGRPDGSENPTQEQKTALYNALATLDQIGLKVSGK